MERNQSTRVHRREEYALRAHRTHYINFEFSIERRLYHQLFQRIRRLYVNFCGILLTQSVSYILSLASILFSLARVQIISDWMSHSPSPSPSPLLCHPSVYNSRICFFFHSKPVSISLQNVQCHFMAFGNGFCFRSRIDGDTDNSDSNGGEWRRRHR